MTCVSVFTLNLGGIVLLDGIFTCKSVKVLYHLISKKFPVQPVGIGGHSPLLNSLIL